jgi:hypothetical protein
MYRFYLLLILTFYRINLYGQIELSVESVEIFETTFEPATSYVEIEGYSGPVMWVNCHLKNISGEMINLKKEYHQLFLEYTLNNNKIIKNSVSLIPEKTKWLYFDTNEVIFINFPIYLFAGTEFFIEGKTDYTSELEKIIPTIIVTYQDLSYSVKTSRIRKVIVY